MKQTKSFAQVVQRMSLMAVFLLLTLICYAQSIIVKGSIKDQAGDPIAGATVKILGTTTGGFQMLMGITPSVVRHNRPWNLVTLVFLHAPLT